MDFTGLMQDSNKRNKNSNYKTTFIFHNKKMQKQEGAERRAYHAYKEYAKRHLGKTREERRLSRLWAPDFDYRFYSKQYDIKDPIDVLGRYLDDLKPYVQVLKEAARLREYHFTNFIEKQTTEDAGHRNYREGLTLVAQDAEEKWLYWDAQWNEKLNELVRKHEAKISSIKEIATIEDPDDYDDVADVKPEILRKPKISDREKRKRKRERKKQRQRAEKQALDAAISERSAKRDDVLKSYPWSGDLNVNEFFIEVSPTEMIELIRRAKQEEISYNMFYDYTLFRVVNFGENDVETSLRFIFHELFSFPPLTKDAVAFNAVAAGVIVFLFFNYDVVVNNLFVLLDFIVKIGETEPQYLLDRLIGCFPSFNEYIQASRRLSKQRKREISYFSQMDMYWLEYRYHILTALFQIILEKVLPKINTDEFGTFIELYPQFKKFLQDDPFAELPRKQRKFVVFASDQVKKLKKTLKAQKQEIRSVLPISSRISDCCDICGNFALYHKEPTGINVCSRYCDYIHTYLLN